MEIDSLVIYRGADYQVTDTIIVHQPTLGEICDYGEAKFFNMIRFFTSVGADLKWQLWDMGIDYTTVSDYDLFTQFICKVYRKEDTEILFGNLNFKDFEIYKNSKTDELVLFNKNTEEIVDRYSYSIIVDVLRKTYGLKRNDELPANEFTKKILIDDARDEYEMNKDKPYKSQLLNFISSMVNSEGFKHDEISVFDMKIAPFMDSVARISKIKNASLLLQSGYSGYGISLKEIDKKQIDWTGEL